MKVKNLIRSLSLRQKTVILLVSSLLLSLIFVQEWVLAAVVATFGAMFFILIRDIERGNSRQFRKTEKLQKAVAELAKEQSKAPQGDSSSKESVKQADYRAERQDELLSYLSSFLKQLNSFSSISSSMSLAQVASVQEIVQWVEPKKISASPRLYDEVSALFSFTVSSFDPMEKTDETCLVLLSEREISTVLGGSVFDGKNANRVIALVESTASAEQYTIPYYTEVFPLPFLYGVRIFYPTAMISKNPDSELYKKLAKDG